MAKTGRCLCGKVTYTFEGDPIATAVCHCSHCQRQGGSAFSVNLIAMSSQMTVNGELVKRGTYDKAAVPDGAEVEVIHMMSGG